jgi:hypothetical protein
MTRAKEGCRLFKVLRGSGPDAETIGYYRYRSQAKTDRDNLNHDRDNMNADRDNMNADRDNMNADRDNMNADRDKPGGGPWTVARGPDHWRGESFNVSKQTPSSKRSAW